jgi:hypothetical protein
MTKKRCGEVEKWNLLPDDVKSAPNGAIFRHKMSKL